MSRTYAIVLILIVPVLIGSLFFARYQYLTAAQSETADYAEEVHERVITGQLEVLREKTQEISKLLEDDSKARFRPIQGLIFKVEEQREIYLDLSRSIKPNEEGMKLSLETLALLHAEQLNWLEESAVNFLLKHKTQVDLNDKEVNNRTALLKAELNGRRSTLTRLSNQNMDLSLKRDLLTVDYLNAVTMVLLDIFALTGGQTLICFPPPDFFPVINDGFSDPKPGEAITTSISIGNLDYSHHPDDMFVLINKDTLRMEDYSMQSYTFKPRRRGKQVLEMELHVRNPLTGLFSRQGINHYNFHVR